MRALAMARARSSLAGAFRECEEPGTARLRPYEYICKCSRRPKLVYRPCTKGGCAMWRMSNPQALILHRGGRYRGRAAGAGVSDDEDASPHTRRTSSRSHDRRGAR